ncbi:hypothetical protein KKB43_06855 [Patescibacteria group bacterium]|nr:hypothetical protein [Patescibacteria group bacterium]
MIAEKILSEITPEKIKEEVEKIKAAKLPPKLEECVREYEKVGKRERFSWQNENSYSQFHFDIIPNNAIIFSIV